MAGKYQKSKPKKQSVTWKKPLIITLAVILALLVAVVVAGVVYYNSMLNKMKKVDVPKINYTTPSTEYVDETKPTEEATTATETEATEPHIASSADYINFLVVGQDARDGEQNHLSDTMILCTVNTYEKTITATSIFRDTLVQVPGSYTDSNGRKHTWGGVKMNMMYANGYQWDGTAGSMAVLNQTLYDNFGIEVDYNFEVDFDCFVKAINIIGGVELDLTEAEANYLNSDGKVWMEVQPGKNWVDGDTALAYARMRKAEGDGESDIKRTSRQRKVIEAVVVSLRSWDLKKVQGVINEILPMITTSMDNSEITEMIVKLLPILPEMQVLTGGTCPQEGAYWGDIADLFSDGTQHSILRWDANSVKKHMLAVTKGEIAE